MLKKAPVVRVPSHGRCEPRRCPAGLWFSLSGLQVVFQDGIVGGEAAELAVVIAQAVGHAVALVVAGILSLTF